MIFFFLLCIPKMKTKNCCTYSQGWPIIANKKTRTMKKTYSIQKKTRTMKKGKRRK